MSKTLIALRLDGSPMSYWHNWAQAAGPDSAPTEVRGNPRPIINFGLPSMIGIQTELHLRHGASSGRADKGAGLATCAIVIAADLVVLSLLAVALF
jgi:hypothetical protein